MLERIVSATEDANANTAAVV